MPMARSADMTGVRYVPPARQRATSAEGHATLARILDAIDEYVYTGEFLADNGYQVVFAGPCRERFLGMSIDAARTAVWADYVHPDDVAIFDAAHATAHVTGRLDVEYRLIGADGVVRWVRDRGRVRDDDDRRYLDGSILDVTAMHSAREALAAAHARADRLARTDALTGVANRRSLPELLAPLVDVPLGLLSIDVDRFKQINDFYGHAAGDAVLVELADRFRETLRIEDRIVRMGGEEFLVLLPGVADEATLFDLAERVRRCVSDAPAQADDQSVPVTVSIGATFAAAERDFDALLAVADRFLYGAKRAGRNRVQHAALDRADEDAGDEESVSLHIAHAMAAAAAATANIPDDHLTSVSLLAARIARHLHASGPQVLRCRLAGLLHDLGKLRIPPAVLDKPDALDAEESALVRRHSEYGEELVAAVPELAPVASAVRHHHERYDGGGYPDGLAGEAIPLEARIVAAADTWHAMTSDRPCRNALPASRALDELDRVAGRQLDPTVVAALRSIVTAPQAKPPRPGAPSSRPAI